MLCKAHWYNSDPNIAYNSPIDQVFKAYHFEQMTRVYKVTALELNKEK